jgi:hypothetical protein
MARKKYTGNAPAKAQVRRYSFAGLVAPDDLYTWDIHGKTIEVETTGDTFAALCAELAAAWNASELPEYAEVTAAAEEDDEGNPIVTLTADTAGKPFDSALTTSGAAVVIVTTQEGSDGVDEVQSFYLEPAPAGGTYQVQWDLGSGVETSDPIPAGSAASVVQAKCIAGMASLDEGDLVVTGSGTEADPFELALAGNLAATPVAELTIDASGLTGNRSVHVSTSRDGASASSNELWTIYTDGGTAATFKGRFRRNSSEAWQETATLNWNDSAATVQAAFEALSNVGAGNVLVSGGRGQTTNTFAFFLQFRVALGGVSIGGAGGGVDSSTANVVAASLAQGGQATANEYQIIHLGGATAGTFTLTHGGDTTSAIAFDAISTTIRDALIADTALVAGDVLVAQPGGTAGLPHYVRFQGTVANTNVAALTIGTGSLTGTGTIETARDGGAGAAVNELQELWHDGTGGTVSVTIDGETIGLPWDADATEATNLCESVLGAGNLDVTGAGTEADPWVFEYTGDYAAENQPELTASAASLTGGIDAVVDTVTEGVAPTDEVQTITLDGATGGTFRLRDEAGTPWTAPIAYDAAAATVETALEAILGAGNVAVSGSAGGPYTVTGDGDLADQDLPLLLADNDDLDGDGSATITETDVVASSGPNHWDDPLNWIDLDDGSHGVPETGDDVFIETGGVGQSILYGLEQSAVELASLTISSLFTGTIGLPQRNEDGEVYWEYRPRELEIGLSSGGTQTITIGTGVGTGSERINLNTGADETHLVCLATNGPKDEGFAAVNWRGTHASNTALVIDGFFGAGVEQGQEYALALIQRGGSVILGGAGDVGSIDKTGGDLTADRCTLDGTLFIRG